jgi:solute carrier family 44 (choline transporter-like protein), member 2/4/5
MGKSRAQEGPKYNLSDGPVKNRGCTDILFFLLFAAHIVVYVSVAATGITQGEPVRLLTGQDYQGKLCGLPSQVTDEGLSLSNATNLYYSMNVTTSLETVVGGMFSSSNTTAFDPNAVYASSASILDPVSFIGTWGNSLIIDMTNYFSPVCTTVCGYNVSDSSASALRTYVWEGPSDPTMVANWDDYVLAASTTPSLMDPFTFTALPESICPYPAKNCVPLQYANFTSILDRYCVPQILNADLSLLVPESFSSSVSNDLGDLTGDIITSWPAILIMAFVGLAIGVVYLYILRMCVGVFIWISIFLCFLLILASAISCLLYSQKCVGESMFTAATEVDTTDALSTLFTGTKACTNGYSIQSDSGRDSFRYLSYGLFGVAGIYILVILFIANRIRLGIAVNKVAAQFVRQNMSTLLVPIIQTLASIIWWGIWVVCIVYTITVIPEGYRDMSSTWVGNMTEASAGCNGQAGVYVRSYSNTTSPPSPVYACKEAKYVIGWNFWYSIGSLFWINGFVLSCGQCIIAGAVGVWYFTANSLKGSLGFKPIRTGFRNTFVYHVGTMAFGSLLIAIVNVLRLMFFWVAKVQKRNPGNKLIAIFAWIMYGFLSFLEKVMRFINKNAYIQTALMGTNFCVSCKNAIKLILNNAMRIGTLGFIGGVVHFLGISFISVGTVLAGWGILATWFDGQLTSPIGPLLVIFVVGYCIGSIVISVFSISVDAILQCFVCDEEMNKDDGGAKFTPALLQKFVEHEGTAAKSGRPVDVVGI